MPARTVREAKEFTEQLQSIGDIERLDDALRGVYWAVATNPEEFAGVVGSVRLVKTIRIGGVPALCIRFRVVDEDLVELLHVELASTSPFQENSE